MYKKKLCAGVVLLLMMSADASAGNRHHVVIDGGITHFRGVLTAEACTVSTDSRSQTVDMGPLRSNQFNGVGSLTSPVSFSIRLTECSTAVSDQVGVAFYGVTDGKDPQVLKAGEGSSAATGVGLALFDEQGQIIVPNTQPRIWNRLHDGDNSLRFHARYRATSRQVTGGNADAFTWFALTYQ
ncbi:TPA: fimbrial protein [Escherichia coli]|uniref:fimbrial protein n=1 Tax=Escherichia coli TaxID=562 RepID=UPI000BEA915F|nr:fimbrial protein [Escherichia coli]EKA5221993.1 fimbrial protein [Escherichia coli]EKY6695666.1 fimbrial protein [Escherichia coli]ELV1448180.1 fimbrial protein [Escherichia coli]HBN7285210.1 fimbrial protein [Escherichia coli]